jgi:hypothetical protein
MVFDVIIKPPGYPRAGSAQRANCAALKYQAPG